MSSSARLLLLVTAVLAPNVGRADDSKKDSLTAEPWTEATAIFTGEEKRASLAYSQFLPRDLAMHIQLSAPLDEDTKLAAFTSNNELASGFKSSFQFGYDGRASHWRNVAKDLQTIKSIRKALVVSPVAAQKANFCNANGLRPCSDLSVKPVVCSAGCSVETEAAEVEKPGWTAKCSAGLQQLGANAPGVPDWTQLGDVACFRQAWAHHFLTRQKLYREGLEAADRLYPARATLAEVARRLLSKEEIAKAELQGVPLEEALLYNEEAFAVAIEKLLEGGPLAVRDAFVTGVFRTPSPSYALLLDASLSLDRFKIHQDDVGTKANDETVVDFEIGANYTAYTGAPGLSLNFRAGYEYSRESKAKPFKRCANLTSSDGTVTGQQCDEKALFRSGERPDATHAPYVRFAVDYQYLGTPKGTSVIPGIDLRLGAESLTDDREFEGRLSLYATPVNGSTAARMGIAADAIYDATPDTANDEPKLELVFMLFIGLTTSDLMKL